jgi:hypothetical protein
MLGGHRQPHQRSHRPLSAQHRISELEQRIRPQRQAVIEHLPKHGKITQTRHPRTLAPTTGLLHTDAHGHHPCLRDLWKEPEDDQAVAGPSHADTPNKINGNDLVKPQRLNKLSRSLRGDC